MSSRFWTFVFSIVANTGLLAQHQFLKTYDFGYSEEAYQLVYYKERIFIGTATICGNECSYISEIDSSGSILWRTEIPDIDIASNSIVIIGDTITVTGNNDPLNTSFLMAHFSLNGEKYGQTILISHPTKKYNEMFLLTTEWFNGKFILSGTGVQNDTNWSLMYVVNSIGEIDTLIAILPTNWKSRVWDSFIDIDGNLTEIHQVEFAHSDINYRKIIKYNENYDSTWSYTSEINDKNEVIPYSCELNDGRIILAYINPDGIRNINSIRAINLDGSIDWQHDYAISPSRNRIILRLKELSNGDIMGSGIYSEIANIPRIQDATWLFRMSSEGQLLWERTFFELDTNLNQAKPGALYDFTELEGGDILATGYLIHDDHDMLILRFDSSGCLISDQCNEMNIITSNTEFKKLPLGFETFPNPVSSSIFIKMLFPQYGLRYEIVDIVGKLIMSGDLIDSVSELDVQSLSEGVYFISIKNNQLVLQNFKIIKT